MTNVLLLSATASAINVIRSLTRRTDVRLFVTDANCVATGLYLPGVFPIVVPRAKDLDSYCRALDTIISLHAIDVLIPSSDKDVEGVLKLFQRGWNPPVSAFRPDYSAFQTLSHKGRLAEFLREKVPYIPRSFQLGGDVEFPAVVKPVMEGGSKGVEIVNNEKGLLAAVARLNSSFPGEIEIQQYIPGGVGSIHIVPLLYDEDGKYLGGTPLQSHLTFMTWGGGGNAGVISDETSALDQAREVVALAGGWRGPINVEFKRHSEDGRLYLMEANCRLNGYSYLTTMNGIDFPSAIVNILTRQAAPDLTCPDSGNRKNFILGFREMPVEKWCSEWLADK